MREICPKCGLSKDLCVCQEIAKEEQHIKIKAVKRRFGKLTTMIAGIDNKEIDIKELAKKLKAKFACGGTVKDKIIELQGDHTQKAKDELINLGFAPGTISIIR
ncbi:MAG TPA: stress response translation initiation inhibitor YciH [Candidatus Nanoarchaeia archaeon]|nr:stress response translation initiation inhibitor YciH [Candidatus Nanoarchaeia archaeon]